MLFQVEEEYGVDWTGPHNHHPSNVVNVPGIQLPRALDEQELAELPNTNVPFSQALGVYLETVHALKLLLDTPP